MLVRRSLTPQQDLARWMRKKHGARAYEAAMAGAVFCAAEGEYATSQYYAEVAALIVQLETTNALETNCEGIPGDD